MDPNVFVFRGYGHMMAWMSWLKYPFLLQPFLPSMTFLSHACACLHTLTVYKTNHVSSPEAVSPLHESFRQAKSHSQQRQ